MSHEVRKFAPCMGPSATPARRIVHNPSLAARLSMFLADRRGVTSIEYSLLASLIAVVIAGICAAMFTALSAEYSEVTVIFK